MHLDARIKACRRDAAQSLVRYRRYKRRRAPAIADLYWCEYTADKQRLRALTARRSTHMGVSGCRLKTR